MEQIGQRETELLEMLVSRRRVLRALELVASVELADWWIVAGFIRCPVWDALHGYSEPTAPGDVDVVFFDRARPAEEDRQIEARLLELDGSYPWEVYNQAHMHHFNGNAPYRSTADSICRWAETVSTVGLSLHPGEGLRLLAPYGVDDLLDMVIRLTPHVDASPQVFEQRLRTKGWLERWPKVTVAAS